MKVTISHNGADFPAFSGSVRIPGSALRRMTSVKAVQDSLENPSEEGSSYYLHGASYLANTFYPVNGDGTIGEAHFRSTEFSDDCLIVFTLRSSVASRGFMGVGYGIGGTHNAVLIAISGSHPGNPEGMITTYARDTAPTPIPVNLYIFPKNPEDVYALTDIYVD